MPETTLRAATEPYDATAMAELVRRGDATPLELVDAAIARIEHLDPLLSAFAHRRFERARAEARAVRPGAPFAGVPFAAKDLGGASGGDPLHGGSAWLRRAGRRAHEDDHVIRRLRRAGFVLVGRTATPELGLGITTEPTALGPTRNPWDRERSAGGSSGGSAAAVAAGLVPVAHGNDGAGSLRIPASCCGIVGLKPTRGRVSLGPAVGEEWGGLTVEGALTSTVRDLAGVLDAIAGPMPGDPSVAPAPEHTFVAAVDAPPRRLRVGVLSTRPDGSPCHPSCAAAATAAAARLDRLGHEVLDAHPAALAEDILPAMLCLVSSGIAHEVDALSRELGPPAAGDLEPDTRALVERGRRVRAVEVHAAFAAFNAYSRRLASWWQPLDGGTPFDLLLTPTLPDPPPPLGALRVPFEQALTQTPFTPPANVAGLPAISLPLHRDGGNLPIGVQLVAAFGRDDLLVRVAAQLEREAPWAQHPELPGDER